MKKVFFPIFAVTIMMMAAFTSCDDKEDNKLTPAEEQKEAVVAALEKNSDLSEFSVGLSALNFANIETDKLTVFAVKNSGMSKSALKATGDDVNMLRQIVKGNYSKSSLTDGLQLTALDGTTLTITVMGGRVYINGVELGDEISAGSSVAYIVEQGFPATANTAQYSITVRECNASWTPENKTPYLTASGASISLRDSLGRAIGPYATGADGKLSVTLVKGFYAYKITKGNSSHISKDGFLIVGIFSSQEEMNSFPQSGAVLGGLKFADLNYDGIINSDDKPSDGYVRLLPSQDAYIAAADFEPSYKPQPPVNVEELLSQLQADFTNFVQKSYFVDAHITQDMSATDVISQPLWDFSFAANNSDITSLWNYGYSVVGIAEQLAESNATNEQKINAAIMRLYAFSVMYPYFGGLPPDSDSPRMSAQETAQFIAGNCDNLIENGNETQKAKLLMLKARTLLNQPQPDYSGAFNAVYSIVMTGSYQLPAGSSLLFGYDWTTSTTVESIWDGIQVGNIKKQSTQTYSYPIRYCETILMLIESSTEMGQLATANQYNNTFRFAAEGWDEPANLDADGLRGDCKYFWNRVMFKEGLRYAFLKRNGILNSELPNVKELLPIPESAINQNPNLTQNPGY